MKIARLRMLAFCLFSCLFANAQKDSILFHVRYLPKMVYTTAMSMKMSVKTNMDTSSGGTHEMGSDGEMVLTTGATKADRRIPVVMEIKKMSMAMPGSPDLTGMKYYGYSVDGGTPHIDSVSRTLDNASMDQVTKTVDAMMAQFVMPDIKMAIGQTYVNTTPMSIPLSGGMAMKMKLTTTYTLKSVQGSLANFDLLIKIDMDMNGSNLPASFTGSGNGTGAMVYDTQTQFFKTSVLKNHMVIAVSGGEKSIQIGLDQATSSTFTVVPAPR